MVGGQAGQLMGGGVMPERVGIKKGGRLDQNRRKFHRRFKYTDFLFLLLFFGEKQLAVCMFVMCLSQ